MACWVLGWCLLSTMAVEPAVAEVEAAPEANALDPGVLLQEDPAAFLKACLDVGAPKLADFRCLFITNELRDGELTGEVVKDVSYRRSPRSVAIKWVANAGKASRVCWIDGRNRAAAGCEQVLVEPRGLARLFVDKVWLSMDDPRVAGASRRPIPEFGPDATLSRLVQENEQAALAGDLELRWEGEGLVDGRPTYRLVRELPYRPGGPYPDARLVIDIDREWLVPLRIQCFADTEARTLLESYEFRRMQPNVGLTDADFLF